MRIPLQAPSVSMGSLVLPAWLPFLRIREKEQKVQNNKIEKTKNGSFQNSEAKEKPDTKRM